MKFHKINFNLLVKRQKRQTVFYGVLKIHLWLSLSCQPDDDERRKAGRGQGGQWPCRGLGQQALSSPTVSTLFIVDHPPLCPQYIPI